MHDTVGASQNGVVTQLQTEAGSILGTIHGSDGTACQRTVSSGSGIIFFPVETALVGFQAEYRDVLYLGEGVIVNTLRINRPVAAHLGATFGEVFLEVRLAQVWEYLVQAKTDGVLLGIPQRVVLCIFQRLEVHEDLKLRQRTCHQLSGTTQDVASVWLHGYGISLLPFCHLHPVIMLGGHDVERFTHYGYGENRHDDGDGAVAGHYFLVIKFAAHSSGTFMMYGGWVAMCSTLSLLFFSMSSTLLSRLFSVI